MIKIIKKCHKNLNSYLEQYLEESDIFNKLLFYQTELVKPIRLIFMKNNDEFIPLIFDLHHLIYESNKKNYDSNIASKKHKWDYKYKQNEFKNKILEINNQN